MDFRDHTARGLARQVRAKEVSARELADAALDRIDRVDGEVNAFVAVDAERARQAADAIDQRIAAGEDVGPLAGVPIGVKDLEDAVGYTTSKGSAIFAAGPPAEIASLHVERLVTAGCVVVGKTNTPEFGFKGDTVNPIFGPTRNPWNLERSPGGSSGGTGAALAAGLVPLATGSDGGGSIRIPGSLCGLAVLKPSLGRIPYRNSPGWLDLSVVAPMARTVGDVAYALDAVVGPYPGDPRSLPAPGESWHDKLELAAMPTRVGWSPDLGYGTVDDEIAKVCAAAIETLAGSGVDVIEVPAVFGEDPGLPWLRISATCNESDLGGYRGTDDWEKIDPELRAVLDLTKSLTEPVHIIEAFHLAHVLHRRVAELLAEHNVPVLLCPTVAGQTGKSGEYGTINGAPEGNWVQFTYPFNLSRNPAGTVPAGLTPDGMPVGLQVVGGQQADAQVLMAMASFEDVLHFDERAAAID